MIVSYLGAKKLFPYCEAQVKFSQVIHNVLKKKRTNLT